MMVIQDVNVNTKYDQILQNSNQEPSTSSKCDCVLDALMIIIWAWKFEYNSGMTNYVDSWFQIWYQIWSVRISTIYLHVNLYSSRITNYIDSWCQIWYQRWSNPPKIQSGIINVLQVWLCSWCTIIMLGGWKLLFNLIMA